MVEFKAVIRAEAVEAGGDGPAGAGGDRSTSARTAAACTFADRSAARRGPGTEYLVGAPGRTRACGRTGAFRLGKDGAYVADPVERARMGRIDGYPALGTATDGDG